MPMFDYSCSSCGHTKSHFVSDLSSQKICPSCSSTQYERKFGSFKSQVEYSDSREFNERVIDPAVSEVYRKIGNEALDEDTQTLENVFGGEKVAETLAPTDD